MRTRHRTLALLFATLLSSSAMACGGDDAATAVDDGVDVTGEAPGAAEDADGPDESGPDESGPDESGPETEVPVVASGDPADPCTLLNAESFEAALGATIDEPEDATEAFTVAGPEVESHACQWLATDTDNDGGVYVYSVELITIPDDTDGAVYARLVKSARAFDDEVTELDLGDEAVGVLDDGSPEIIMRSGDVLLVLSIASDDHTVDDIVPLAAAAVGAVVAN